MRCLVNPHRRALAPGPVTGEATAFHASLAGYAPTPLRDLPAVAAELGLAAVALKDESDRLGLPAFKVLGASWAIERALRERPDVRMLVAASAGNHGRAVAHVARRRGLACRVFLPARSAPARRDAIAAEGAEVIVVDGAYEEAVARARAEGARPGALELADVGASGPARWVIDGYATLFAEIGPGRTVGVARTGRRRGPPQPHGPRVAEFDVLFVPVGVGSLATAAVRHGARTGTAVIGVEPVAAAALTASLAAGAPTAVPTPGTAMAGLDCAEVSPAAWPELRDGLAGTVTVDDAEARASMRELADAGLAIGDCGAATLAALRALATEPGCADLRAACGLGAASRAVLIATEGPTDPDAYREALSARR